MAPQQQQRASRRPSAVVAALAALVAAVIVAWILAAALWGSDGVLVITDGPTAGIEEDERVLVRGTVEQFVFEQGLGADEALFDDFTDVPAVYADQVSPLLNDEEPAVDIPGPDLEEIAEEGAVFEGRDVVVTGEVEEVLGPRSFVLGEE